MKKQNFRYLLKFIIVHNFGFCKVRKYALTSELPSMLTLHKKSYAKLGEYFLLYKFRNFSFTWVSDSCTGLDWSREVRRGLESVLPSCLSVSVTSLLSLLQQICCCCCLPSVSIKVMYSYIIAACVGKAAWFAVDICGNIWNMLSKKKKYTPCAKEWKSLRRFCTKKGKKYNFPFWLNIQFT